MRKLSPGEVKMPMDTNYNRCWWSQNKDPVLTGPKCAQLHFFFFPAIPTFYFISFLNISVDLRGISTVSLHGCIM